MIECYLDNAKEYQTITCNQGQIMVHQQHDFNQALEHSIQNILQDEQMVMAQLEFYQLKNKS